MLQLLPMEFWFIFSLLAAFFTATRGAFEKRALTKEIHPFVLGAAVTFVAGVLLAPVLLIKGFPDIRDGFLVSFTISVFLNVLATWLSYKAFKTGDFSLVAPMFATTPLFLIPIAYIQFGEVPSLAGYVGIVLIVVGIYILKIKEGTSMIEPFRRIYSDIAVRYALFAAFVFSISSVSVKVAVQASSPLFLTVNASLSIGLVFAVLTAFSKEAEFFPQIRGNIKKVLIPGVMAGLSSLAHSTALGLGFVAYAVAIKRSSILFSLGYGAVFFNELKGLSNKEKLQRIIGTVAMFLGVVVIALFG